MEQSRLEQTLLDAFCANQQLPEHYTLLAKQYFLPLAKKINALSGEKPTLLVGINGCQGSGKSTLAALLEQLLTQLHGKKVANLSIDDFYHTQEYRQQLADNIHPLFKTRGVPGTHDTELLEKALVSLGQNKKGITIPRFDKATDNQHAKAQWDTVNGPVDIILLEGWCIGVTQQPPIDLLKPVNTLEEKEDSEGIWRQKINDSIGEKYTSIFSKLDHLIMLKAPNFECVYSWRHKQEEKLRRTTLRKNNNMAEEKKGIMNDAELKRFIEHYQRLTEHMLCYLPKQANTVFELDAKHQITGKSDNGNR